MSRQASSDDLSDIVATLTSAFVDDPLWGPPFPQPVRAAGLSIMWQVLVGSALEHGWVLVSDSVEAASVWIPPDVEELSAEDEHRMHHLLVDHTDAASANHVATILEGLEEAKPADPCYFLSLLGTHARHRGRGIGMALMQSGLDSIDRLGGAAYLESSNPANNDRYARLGFEVRDVLEFPTGKVTTMWRAPQ
jgi:GNAT superfamily N-acetyltransferase